MTSGRFERTALGTAIEKRQQATRIDDHAGDHERRDRLERPGKILQQLEQAQEVPLGRGT